MWIDTHAHVSIMDGPIDVAKRAKESGVDTIINICTDIDSLEKGLALAKECPYVYNVASSTPHDVEDHGEKEWACFEKAAKSSDLIAIGETGLDFFYEHAPRKKQEELLIRYCDLARETFLPLVIHCRDAFDRFYEIMHLEYFGKPGAMPGVLHCFTGDEKDAIPAIEAGWVVSLSGILTFKNGEALRETVKALPIDHLVVETDAPWLAPQKRRGQSNEPAYVVEVGEMLAQIKGLSVEETASITSGNARGIFKLTE